MVMSGPAEAVFDGVVVPGLLEEPADSEGSTPASGDRAVVERPTSEPEPVSLPPVSPALPAIDCATACVQGCLRPEACSSAEARARVAALLEGRSLDELVALATATAENRGSADPRRDGTA